MGLLDKCVDALEGTLEYLAKHFIHKDMTSYCELATAVGLTDADIEKSPDLKDPYTLVNSDYSLLTVFDLQGTYQMLSEAEFSEMLESLRIRMTGYMREKGHSLTFSFERDPERATDELMRLAEPLLNTARRIGLKSEDIILDRVKRNAPHCAWEQNLLVVYTHLTSLSKEEQDRELGELAKSASKHKLPRLTYGQNPAFALAALKYRHDTMIDRLMDDFISCGVEGKKGIMMKPLSAHEAIKRIRIMLNREGTSQKFRPQIVGDRFMLRGSTDAKDYSELVPPRLCYQVCSNDVEPVGNYVKTDSLWHGSLAMELGPQDVVHFSKLFDAVGKKDPWRIRFDISPGGLSMMRARKLMVGFVGVLPDNRAIRDSFKDLEAISKDQAVMSMKVMASCWSNTKTDLETRLSRLEKAIQSWGTCQVQKTHGDPMAALASSIPGFTTKNTANRLLPPLKEAMKMLPLQRPATPWPDNGSWITRTPDGKIYPIGLGSSIQDTWIELVSGIPGSGKSVAANCMHNATLHRPGATQLPLLTIADVGPSSSGLIQMIQDSLPDHRKSEAAYIRLQNNRDFASNPFDPQLGARQPTRREREYCVDFLNLLCASVASDGQGGAKARTPSDCAAVNEMLMTLVYDDKAGRGANLYEPDVVPAVDKVLAESGISAEHDEKWWSAATWYEVTDMLFAAGYVREATFAHRQAAPVLPDFTAMLNNEGVRQTFGDIKMASGGESLLKYMGRCFTLASTTYAVFSGRTRFEVDSTTRVISVDLNDVIGAKTPEGSIRTSCMYMFARHLGAKNYFLREEDIRLVSPPLYLDYHLKRAEDVASQQKTIAYDEWHNTEGMDTPVETLKKDGREGRKWGIRIMVISQYLRDFPQALLNAATSVYVLRGGNVDDENVLRETFKVSHETIQQLHLQCIGPGRNGANMLALFKTNQGTITQILTNTTGPLELWAMSTTQQDMALRKELYNRIGPMAARQVLAKRFPLGSAKTHIEALEYASTSNAKVSVVKKLAEDLVTEYYAEQSHRGEHA